MLSHVKAERLLAAVHTQPPVEHGFHHERDGHIEHENGRHRNENAQHLVSKKLRIARVDEPADSRRRKLRNAKDSG